MKNINFADEAFLKRNMELQSKKHPEYWGSLYKDASLFINEASYDQLKNIGNEFIWLGQYILLIRKEKENKTIDKKYKTRRRNRVIKSIEESDILKDREKARILKRYVLTKSI